MNLLALPLLVLFLAMPQPFGQAATVLVLGRAFGGTDLIIAIPAPPAEDCNCGVPASPRGPR
jgi:hypothetical protein